MEICKDNHYILHGKEKQTEVEWSILILVSGPHKPKVEDERILSYVIFKIILESVNGKHIFKGVVIVWAHIMVPFYK